MTGPTAEDADREPPADALGVVRRALLDHYDARRRSLPWRGERDPYRVLVSEVMLQQTRVETVLGYYDTWLERFPDVEALAAATPDDVLKAWEGLGYYRRARNLQGAARVVREELGGELPSTYEGLRALPGVGEYTAGAVASIAFGEQVPAVDGNVRRVLSRLYDEPAPTAPWLRERAGELVDPVRPGDWNQALMELGATVCTPRGPRCDRCPVAEWCLARERGTQEERPAPVAKRAPRKAVFAVAVIHRRERVLLVRRPPDGLLGGMWAFPEVEVAVENDAAAAAGTVAEELGANAVGAGEPLPVCPHRFTHLDATYVPFLFGARGLSTTGSAGVTWLRLSEPAGVALPVAQRRILEAVRAVIRR